MALVVQATLPPTVVPELPHHQPPHPDLVDVGLALPLVAVLIAAQRFRFSRTLDGELPDDRPDDDAHASPDADVHANDADHD
jgi:hypothetical protein